MCGERFEFPIAAIATFVAAAVTSAIGHGPSSLTVPITLPFFANKTEGDTTCH